jgi:hypothetical protein
LACKTSLSLSLWQTDLSDALPNTVTFVTLTVVMFTFFFCHICLCVIYLFLVPDTAAVYRNEEAIGLALKTLLPKFNLSREDIFLTTKLGN